MHLKTAVSLLILSLPTTALAQAPDLQTKGPVIYLADNLDENDNLGWCIDTLGRGFSEQLQTHSCKPQGGDVQFGYNPETRQIYSVEFEGKCMDLSAIDNAAVPFGLLDCDASSQSQQFDYDADAMQFSLAKDQKLCVTAGAESRSAGPFMSRDLRVAACAAVNPLLSKWVIQQ